MHGSKETARRQGDNLAGSQTTSQRDSSPRRKDFASGDGLTQSKIKILEESGFADKFQVVSPSGKYWCHDYTFRSDLSDENNVITDYRANKYLKEHFKVLGSKEDFQGNPSLYDNLARRLNENKDSCIVIYKRDRRIEHSSPIREVYQKGSGERSIKLIGKWGYDGPLGIHDIEDVPRDYQDNGQTNWEIHFTNGEKGRFVATSSRSDDLSD